MMKGIIVGSFLVFSFLINQAQSIQNVSATFADGKVTVTYDLLGGNANRKYKIGLVGSHNNFATPLNNVSGDVGDNVSPGTGKKIVWNALEELTKYSGQITFKVTGEMLSMPFNFINPTSGKGVRRGKSVSIQWEGGLPDQNVKLEILNAGSKIADITETKNSEQFNWLVPKDLKKGKEYSLKITSGNQTATSDLFAVKPKIPLLVKLSPVVVGAAIIPFLGGGSEPASQKLPTPPDPD